DEAEHDFDRAHTVEQVADLGLLPQPPPRPETGLKKLRVLVDDRLVLDHGAARAAAADDDAGPAPSGFGDERFVLALEQRVRDLEDVEDAHLEVLRQLRQRAGHADEADLALRAQLLELGNRVVLLEDGARRAEVELHDVEIVGLHTDEALLDGRADVLSREAVRLALRIRHVGRLDRAAALGREVELAAAVRDVPAD